MRGVISYMVAGIFTAVAMEAVLPALVSSVGARPVEASIAQTVNRSGKRDRLMTPAASTKPEQKRARSMMVGCDPLFSPLSAAARANIAARCVA